MSGPSIAQLGLRIYSEEVDEAASALDRLVQSGARTNKEMAALNLKQAETARAAGELGNAVGRTNQELAALNLKQAVAARAAGESAQSLAEMAKSASQANAELTALNLKQQYAAQALGDLAKSSGLTVAELRELNVQQRQSAQLLQNLGTVMGQSTAEFRAVAASLNAVVAQNQAVTASAPKTTRAIKEQGDQVARLLGQIDPTVAALDRLDAQQRKLQGFKKSGLIDADTFEQYNSRLEQTRAGLGNFDTQLERTGRSAKATAAAMRGVPAQLTDIVVSLQGGQAPLTVFLQQGGQLKDMFGGIGPAAKALGGYVAGLISPLTLTAAALGVVGIAFIDVEREMSAFNTSVFAGIGGLGLTGGQLQAMAKQAGEVVGSLSGAKEAFLALGAASDLSKTQVMNLGQAAAAIGEYTGKSSAEVATQFSKLGDDATKAAQKASSEFGLVTAAQYEIIKALDDQGKSQAALDVLSESLNQNALKRLELYKGSLSEIEKDWLRIKSAISGAYSAVKGELFPGLDKEIEILERIQKTRAEGGVTGFVSSAFGFGSNSDAEIQKQLDAKKAQRAELEKGKKAQDDLDLASRKYIETDATLQKMLDDSSPAEKRGKAVDDLKKKFIELRDQAVKTGKDNPLLAGVTFDGKDVSGGAFDKIKAGLESKFKDLKVPKIKAPALDTTSFNDLQNDLKLVVGEYENADKKIEAAASAGLISQKDAYTQRAALLDQEKDKVKEAYDAQIASIEALQGRGNLSAQQRISLDQKLSDAQAAQTKALADLDAKRDQLQTKETGRQLQLQQSTDSYTKSLNAQVEALRQQGEQAAAAVGMGREQAALYNQLAGQAADYAKKLSDLDDQKAKGLDQAAYEEKLAKLQQQQQQLQETAIENYKKLQVAQADWANGANGAWQDYLSNARNVAGQTRDAFTDALKGMEDYLLSFITGTKASFKDLVKSIIADFARIQLKQIISGIGGSSGSTGFLASVGQAFGFGGGSTGSGGGSSGVSSALSLADTGLKAYNFLTGTGANLYNAYQAGGLSGVYDYGASSVASYFGSNAASAAGSTLTTAGANAAMGFGGAATGAAANTATGVTVQGLSSAVSGGADAVAAGLGYGAGSGASATAAGSAASSAGLSTLGAAGYGIGGAIAGYQAAGLKGAATGAGGAVAGAYAGAAIGSVVPIIGTAIGAAIGAALGGMLGSSVWGGDWITKDNGLALGVTGGDFDGASFEYQKKKGGLFGKNKKRTNFTPLDSATESALQEVYDTTEDSVETLYKKLGVQLNDGVLSGLTIGRTQISTKDKTQEEIQKEITAWFSTVADSMTSAINDATGAGVGGYNFEALTAFVNNLYSVNDAFRYLRIGMFDTSVAGGKLAESMAAAAGGLSALQQNAAGYYQNFFSDTEKANDTMAEAVRQFGLVNITLPATRDGFRDLVDSMDKTTEAGQEQIATLLGLQGQANAYYNVLEQRMQQATQALAEAQAAMLNGAMATLQRAAKREQDALADAYAARTASLNASLATSQSAVSSLTSMATNLTSALRTLQGQSDAATSVLYGQATATLESAAAIARAGGSLANFQGLDQAASTVAGNSAGRYTDWLSFARDQGRSTALINELSITAGDQLTNAEKSVKSLQDQLDLSKKAYDFQVKAIQSQLDLAQAQLDGINGIDNTLLTLAQALEQFGAAVGVARPGGTGAVNADSLIDAAYKAVLGRAPDKAGADYWKQQLGSGTLNSNNLANAISQAGAANGESINTAYQNILGRAPDAAGLAYWQQQVAAGNISDLNAAIRAAAMANGQIPAFASGGQYMGGKALVGEQGPEIIDFAQPGYVYNARQTAGMLSEADLSRVIALLQQILNKTDAGNDRLFWIADNTRKAAVNTGVLRNQAAAEGATA